MTVAPRDSSETEVEARRGRILLAAAGLWKGRQDLPDFEALRAEWDRVLVEPRTETT